MFRDPIPRSRRRLSPFGIGAIVVALIVVVVVVLVLVTAGSGPSRRAGATSARAANPSGRRTSVTVAPSSVTVAVLNGTGTFHLAADIMDKLRAKGYRPGATKNAPDQGMTSTVVGYTRSGFRADALAVAKSLDLGSASVQGVAPGDRAAACGNAPTCPAQVVVTVGSDLAGAASPA